MADIPDGKRQRRWTKAIFFLLLFICVVIAGALLNVMQSFLKPVILAVLLALVFFPVVKKLKSRWRIPSWLGITLVYIVFFGMFFVIGNILTASLKSIFSTLPAYEEKFRSISAALSELFARGRETPLGGLIQVDEGRPLLQSLVNAPNVQSAIKDAALGAGGTFIAFAKSLFLVTLLSIFLLAEMNATERKIVRAFGDKYSDRVRSVMQSVITETTRYLLIKFIASLLTGTIVGLVCRAVGMDFAVLFGFITFVMNFIPTFGSIIAWAITTLFSLLQFYPTLLPVLVVSASSAATNMLIGQILEPRIEGKDMDISPFGILVSLACWGWLWGFIGMLIAVPMMVMLKIVCENVSFLHPIAVFLGNAKSNARRRGAKPEDGEIEELSPADDTEMPLEELEAALDDGRR